MNVKLNWDGVGIVTSVVCAIHCALLPVIIPSLPFLGIDLVHSALFEWGMILLAFIVGMYALVHGFIKHHRSWTPVLIFGAGFGLLVAKQFVANELYFLIGAVLLIITAHTINYRLCHRSKCHSPHHSH